jgi:hypothetical protein
MKEIQAEKVARHLMAMEIFCRREDGGWAVKDGPASNRAELGGAEDRGEDWDKAGHQDLGKQLIVRPQKSDGPQLGGHWHPGHFGKQPDSPLAERGWQETLSKH